MFTLASRWFYWNPGPSSYWVLFGLPLALLLASPGICWVRWYTRLRLSLASESGDAGPDGMRLLDALLAASNAVLLLVVALPTASVMNPLLPPLPLGRLGYVLTLGAGAFVTSLGWRCRRPAVGDDVACSALFSMGALTFGAYLALGLAGSGSMLLLGVGRAGLMMIGITWCGLIAVTAGTALGEFGTARAAARPSEPGRRFGTGWFV